MARVKRSPRPRRERINPIVWAFVNDEPAPEGANPFTWLMLETGISDRRERDRIRVLWDSLRDDVLSRWTREKPGTRPRLWWEFDAPHPRLVISGQRTMDDDSDEPPTMESQTEYLARNGLLTPMEQRALGKARAS